MFDFNKLNTAQLKAVKHLTGPLLCLAGAGSGKTTTLTYRVANLIENNINPSSILLLTFTKKAANDMINRVKTLIGTEANSVISGTFHHFASQIINRYSDRLGINNRFTVIDDGDSTDIIHSLRNTKSNNNYKLSKNLIFQIISKSRNNSLTINNTISNYYYNYQIDEDYILAINQLYAIYKKENNLLDYDDLLEYLYRLLLIPDVYQVLSDQFQYIMVDEYQDTNKIQATITNLLSKKHNNIMVVGDDAQSIYSFRGSKIENILNFKKDYPNCKVIKLEENYRSFGYILKGCNSLIANSTKCLKKVLHTDKPDGNKIILVKCESEKEEATLVAQRIIQLYKKGYQLKDIAVLFRNSSQSYELELELAKRAIPYKKTGGAKIFDSEHIRNIISYLRILNNPYDKISWIKILMLIKGIGIQSATSIFEQLKIQTEPFDLTNFNYKKEIAVELKKLSNLFLNCVKFLNKEPVFLINFIVDYYLTILENKEQKELSKIIKELDQLTLVSSKYTRLQELLSEIYIDKSDDIDNDTNKNEMKLNLSTIHSAKGLEWKQVIIINAVDGRFPSFSSVKKIDELEEERRLMYVAMTRAMEGLMITYPSGIWDKFSREFLTKPSRFINEISSENLEVWQIKH